MAYLSAPPRDRRRAGGDDAALARALGRFRLFHGFCAPRILTRCRCRRMPRVLVDVGELRGLIYRADRGGGPRTYIHFMETPPRLACDGRGRQLYVLGGRYRITPRGIEG